MSTLADALATAAAPGRTADGLATAIADAAAAGAVPLRTGTVTAIAGPQVVVTVAGTPLTLSRFTWYAPTVGDVVQILVTTAGWLVLGKVAS